MSVVEVGEVSYLAPNVIIWRIPSFSLFSQNNDTQIWSPSFVHCGDDVNSACAPWVPQGFLGLICRCEDGKKTHVKCVRFGIADMKNSEICCCDGEWKTIPVFPGYFKVTKFVSLQILNWYSSTFKENSRYRLFCAVISNQHCQVVSASARKDKACAIASPFNTVSTSKKEENWICGYCTFSNFVNKVYCEVCGIPNSAKQKYPAIASPFNSVSTSKKEENWICGYCTSSNSVNKVYCEVCGIPNSAKQKYPVTRRVCPLGLPMPEIFTSPRAAKEASHNEKEIVSSNYCKKMDESKNRKLKTIASPVSPTSAAIKENWECRRCTLINLADASNCEVCNLPKSAEHKYLESSEKLISPVGNPATPDTNLPLCIICFNKERNIVFQPCGHLITCNDCADFRMDNCPLCRKDIQNKLKTFIN